MWPYAERYSVVDMQTVPNGTCVSVESRVVSMTFGNSQETVTQVSAMHIPCNLYESEIRHRSGPRRHLHQSVIAARTMARHHNENVPSQLCVFPLDPATRTDLEPQRSRQSALPIDPQFMPRSVKRPILGTNGFSVGSSARLCAAVTHVRLYHRAQFKQFAFSSLRSQQRLESRDVVEIRNRCLPRQAKRPSRIFP